MVARSAGARTGPIAVVPRANAVPTSSVPSNDERRARYAASDSSAARAAGDGAFEVIDTATAAPGVRVARAGVVAALKTRGSPAGGMIVTATFVAFPPSARSCPAKSSPKRNRRRTGTVAGFIVKVEVLRTALTLVGSSRNPTSAAVRRTTAAYPHEARAPGWTTVPSMVSAPVG